MYVVCTFCESRIFTLYFNFLWSLFHHEHLLPPFSCSRRTSIWPTQTARHRNFNIWFHWNSHFRRLFIIIRQTNNNIGIHAHNLCECKKQSAKTSSTDIRMLRVYKCKSIKNGQTGCFRLDLSRQEGWKHDYTSHKQNLFWFSAIVKFRFQATKSRLRGTR